MAVETEVPAVAASFVKPAFPPVAGKIVTIMANVHPVIPDISAIIPIRVLGLGGGSGEDEADCDQYGNFRFHNIQFLFV
jgi:hypothetical protein